MRVFYYGLFWPGHAAPTYFARLPPVASGAPPRFEILSDDGITLKEAKAMTDKELEKQIAVLEKELNDSVGVAETNVVRTQFSIHPDDLGNFKKAVYRHFGPDTLVVNAKLIENGGKHPTLKVARCPLAFTRLDGEGPGGSLQVWIDKTTPRKKLIVSTDGGLVLTPTDLDGFGISYRLIKQS
jgi:hypothetical protein